MRKNSKLIISSIPPAIGAALISGVLSIIAVWYSHKSNKLLKHEDIESKSLSDQLKGWKGLVDSLVEGQKQIQKRLSECEHDRERLWDQIKQLKIVYKYGVSGKPNSEIRHDDNAAKS